MQEEAKAIQERLEKIPAYDHGPQAHGARLRCSCCLKGHKLTSKGRVARHGWRVFDSGAGYGYGGWHSASCRGSGGVPIEQTDRLARAEVLVLIGGIAKNEELLAQHQAGTWEAYTATCKVDGKADEKRAKELREALQADGFEARETEGHETYGYGNHRTRDVTHFTFKLTKERPDFDGPGYYQKFRYSEERTLAIQQIEQMLAALRRLVEGLLTALEQCAAQGAPRAVVEAPKGPALHAATFDRHGRSRGAKCGAGTGAYRRGYAHLTEDDSRVTCKRCLKALEGLGEKQREARAEYLKERREADAESA